MKGSGIKESEVLIILRKFIVSGTMNIIENSIHEAGGSIFVEVWNSIM